MKIQNKKMIDMISHVDDLDMIMYNSYDIFKTKLTDHDLRRVGRHTLSRDRKVGQGRQTVSGTRSF